jgi:hypothetical protein
MISTKNSTNSESFNGFGRGRRIDWRFPMDSPENNAFKVVCLQITNFFKALKFTLFTRRIINIFINCTHPRKWSIIEFSWSTCFFCTIPHLHYKRKHVSKVVTVIITESNSFFCLLLPTDKIKIKQSHKASTDRMIPCFFCTKLEVW